MSHRTEIIQLRVVVMPENVEDLPVSSKLRATSRGRITHVVWQFPTGSDGHIHARLESAEDPLVPTYGAMALGGGPPLPFPNLDIPLPQREPGVRLVAWTDAGNTEPTTVDVYVTIEPLEAT